MNDTKKMLDKYNSIMFGCRKQGWDGYGAAPISDNALTKLWDLMHLMFYYQRINNLNWPEPFIAPVPNAGFQFEFDRGDTYTLPSGQLHHTHHLEIEVFDKEVFAAEMLSTKYNETTKKEDMVTGDIDNPTDFLLAIEDFFKKEADE